MFDLSISLRSFDVLDEVFGDVAGDVSGDVFDDVSEDVFEDVAGCAEVSISSRRRSRVSIPIE